MRTVHTVQLIPGIESYSTSAPTVPDAAARDQRRPRRMGANGLKVVLKARPVAGSLAVERGNVNTESNFVSSTLFRKARDYCRCAGPMLYVSRLRWHPPVLQ